MADEPNGGAAAGAETGAAAGAGGAAAGTPAAGAAAAAGPSPAAGAAAAGAAAVVQTDAEKSAAAAAEAARVEALTPEQKAAEAKAAADAPADYSGLKMPEGYKTDDPVFGEALKIFEGLKLPAEGAQQLLDFTVERDKALAKAVNDNAAAAWEKQAGDWKTATEKEFSAEDLGAGKGAAVQVFDKETLGYLEGLKLTSNPGFVRAMVKISKAISDDTWVTGNAANGAARTAQAMFPNSKMNP